MSSTNFRIITNRYLRIDKTQDVEWGYAFDIHLNAFFPPLVILHIVQLFFYNGKSLFDIILSKLLIFLFLYLLF